jgi:hypothetical protein
MIFELGDFGWAKCRGSDCILSLNLSGMSWPPSFSAFSILSEQSDPSRIVVEDIETGGQEASIYLVLKAIIAPPSPGVDVP